MILGHLAVLPGGRAQFAFAQVQAGDSAGQIQVEVAGSLATSDFAPECGKRPAQAQLQVGAGGVKGRGGEVVLPGLMQVDAGALQDLLPGRGDRDGLAFKQLAQGAGQVIAQGDGAGG